MIRDLRLPLLFTDNGFGFRFIIPNQIVQDGTGKVHQNINNITSVGSRILRKDKFKKDSIKSCHPKNHGPGEYKERDLFYQSYTG